MYRLVLPPGIHPSIGLAVLPLISNLCRHMVTDHPDNWWPSTLFGQHTPHKVPVRWRSSGVLQSDNSMDTSSSPHSNFSSILRNKLSLVDIANGRIRSDGKAGDGDGGV